VEVVAGSGVYGAASCNTTAGVDLVVTGAGVGVSVFDCGSGARLLATNASLWVTDLTVQNTAFVGNGSALCQVSGGGAILVANNATQVAVGLTRVAFLSSQTVLSQGVATHLL
jgi:hypothetical protein